VNVPQPFRKLHHLAVSERAHQGRDFVNGPALKLLLKLLQIDAFRGIHFVLGPLSLKSVPAECVRPEILRFQSAVRDWKLDAGHVIPVAIVTFFWRLASVSKENSFKVAKI
jgi:hypothetical protein